AAVRRDRRAARPRSRGVALRRGLRARAGAAPRTRRRRAPGRRCIVTVRDVRQIAEKDLKSARFPAVRDEFRVVFAEEAFDRAVTRGDADTTREIGGVLVGEL